MPRTGPPATTRWRRLARARIEEFERLAPQLGSLTGEYWDRAAGRTDSPNLQEMAADPFVRRLLRVTDGSTTAIDVGSGRGRVALPLAAAAAHVTAVDPSGAMLSRLQEDACELGLTNVSTAHGTWEEADVPEADVAFSSFVLPLVPDAAGFVSKLEARATRHVFLYLGAYSGDAVLDPLWRHFHDSPRAPGPTYLDALAVLRELGIEPDLRLVEIPNRRRWATIDEAVGHYREALLLPEGDGVEEELASLLADWLLGRSGALRSPLRSAPAAIVHWRPRR